MTEPSEPGSPTWPLELPPRIRGAIRFENVRFHYGKAGGVIDDFSLAIQPGEKVGLVGRSGAGKSTLVNLLLRFYDVEGGRILIDGQDIALTTQESLRQQIGMVTQDTSLLHRSIGENIRYGRPDATDEALIVETDLPSAALVKATGKCAECHRRATSDVQSHRAQRHADEQRQRRIKRTALDGSAVGVGVLRAIGIPPRQQVVGPLPLGEINVNFRVGRGNRGCDAQYATQRE